MLPRHVFHCLTVRELSVQETFAAKLKRVKLNTTLVNTEPRTYNSRFSRHYDLEIERYKIFKTAGTSYLIGSLIFAVHH